ncbi:MAG: ERF family protein [Dehalococcoidia bacterium]
MIRSFECPRASDTLGQLFAALSKAQGAIQNPKKDERAGDPKKFSYQYATLQSVWDAIRKPLKDNELSLSQWLDTFPKAPGEYLEVLVTVLGHGESGQWRGAVSIVTPDQGGRMNSLQARGSATTYLRRYALMSVMGVAPEDDDGQAAADSPRAAPAKASRRKMPEKTTSGGPTPRPAPREVPSEAVIGGTVTTRASDEEVAEAMAKPMLVRQRELILELALGRGMSLERMEKLIQGEGWCAGGFDAMTVEQASEFYNYLAQNPGVR